MQGPSVVVVGAGVFGGFTALSLAMRGARVTLVDAWGPGHSRASSGGESRVIRATYGPDGIYVSWVVRSLALWKELEARFQTKLFHETGALWLADEEDEYERSALPLLREHGVRFEELSRTEAGRRFPQFHLDDVAWTIYEPDAGYLLARRACQTVQRAVLEAGGTYVQQAAKGPPSANGLELTNGDALRADAYVFACGPWLGQLFPELGASLIEPTRQEIYYFGTPAGDDRFSEGACPVWIDNGARIYYGIPGTEWRGFKLADDSRGERVDPTTMDRTPSAAGIEAARDYLEFRFPGMKGAPLVEARVCQYENSPDQHFLIDRHPENEAVWIVGGGSGHGFKHGPALGEHVAKNVLGETPVEPFFGLKRLG